MELIRAATLCVSDVQASKARYIEHLDYNCAEDGFIPEALALSWGAPKTAGQAYTILQPASGAPVFIRLIEQPAVPDYKPLRSYGWAAIEICTQDTLAVNTRMKTAPFDIIGAPKLLDGMPAIFPMQVKGPDEEIIYLTEIKNDMSEYNLPRAESLIDKLFILVMACRDIKQTGTWFERRLGYTQSAPISMTYTMINEAFDLPPETKHQLMTLTHARDVFLEIDAYPPNTESRPQHADMLPPGVAIGSFIQPDFHQINEINTDDWITPPQRQGGVIYDGKFSASLRDPDGTLIEIIEV